MIQACKQGSHAAFRVLVDQHTDMAFRLALRILNEEEEAEDAVQEAFIAAWKNISRFKDSNSFSSWFYKIVVNKCYDVLKSGRKKVLVRESNTFAETIDHAVNNPEDLLSRDETLNLIKQLSEKLSPRQKLAFVLIDLEGLSHDEAAKVSGMSKSTLKSNLNHARRTLGEKIKKHLS